MIEKMKFLSITGPKDDIDRIADVYLSKYEMHLENALVELNNVKGLRPFVDTNPYKSIQTKCDELAPFIDSSAKPSEHSFTLEEAVSIINESFDLLTEYKKENEKLKFEADTLDDSIHNMEPFRLIPVNLSTLINFKFIKFRYGKITHEHFNKFLKYEYSDLEVIFYETDSDDLYVWGMYFVPDEFADKIDAIFASLQFENIELPKECSTTTDETYEGYFDRLNEIYKQQKKLYNTLKNILSERSGDLLVVQKTLSSSAQNREIRKYAACTQNVNFSTADEHKTFYILCGWMSKKDAHAFLKDIETDKNIFCMSEDGQETISKPPTKLKNLALFKPFEMFISMYGLPAYNEIDPTMFIALTYSFLFGMMFGDVGQGFLLLVAGLIIYKKKHMSLAAILSLAGFFSTIFGFMYGSVFGFEDVFFNHLWLSPMHNVMTVLYTAIGFGIFLNFTAMILNIINGIKSHNKEKIFFDTNGIAGFIFYLLVVGCIVLFILGYNLPATGILVVCFAIPLLCIFLREPLGRFVEKKKKLIEGSKGMFFVEAFFELFEILLSFMTNSLSFVRVGAFALSHAGMMSVVLMLGNAEKSLTSLTTGNIVVLIIGNLFVMGLEGLCVGIQVLRLEYYEMFSRFYIGTGHEFKPFKTNCN